MERKTATDPPRSVLYLRPGICEDCLCLDRILDRTLNAFSASEDAFQRNDSLKERLIAVFVPSASQ